MDTTTLGQLQVTSIGLGCNNFGGRLDAAGSATVVGAALDAGITLFDTADYYGEGRSEAHLAKALGTRRDEVVVATKFGLPVAGEEGSGGARPAYVRRAVERSLRQLGTDRIDLYQLHLPDPETPIAATLEALSELVEEGKVREIGCSNFTAPQMLEAEAVGAPHRFVSNQIEYSMVNRAVEVDGVAEVAMEHGLALLPYRPLAKGLLTGKHRRDQLPTSGVLARDRFRRFLTDRNWDIVDELRTFAKELGIGMPSVALAWLLSRPTVPTVIPGAMNVDQVRSNVAAGSVHFAEEQLARLDQILGAPTDATSQDEG